MAHLYINPGTDSIYLDVTDGSGAPESMVEVTDGFFLHVDGDRAVVAVEVMDVGERGHATGDEAGMGHVRISSDGDSLYLDVSAGMHTPAGSAPVADGVRVHADDAGALVGIEVTDLRARGGLRVDDLDAESESVRPAIFDEIERTVARR